MYPEIHYLQSPTLLSKCGFYQGKLKRLVADLHPASQFEDILLESESPAAVPLSIAPNIWCLHVPDIFTKVLIIAVNFPPASLYNKLEHAELRFCFGAYQDGLVSRRYRVNMLPACSHLGSYSISWPASVENR